VQVATSARLGKLRLLVHIWSATLWSAGKGAPTVS
jgi:hypothetical protein